MRNSFTAGFIQLRIDSSGIVLMSSDNSRKEFSMMDV